MIVVFIPKIFDRSLYGNLKKHDRASVYPPQPDSLSATHTRREGLKRSYHAFWRYLKIFPKFYQEITKITDPSVPIRV
jgi:hypothetical protein